MCTIIIHHNRIHNVYIATKRDINCIRKGLTRVFTVPTITTKLDVANYIYSTRSTKSQKSVLQLKLMATHVVCG